MAQPAEAVTLNDLYAYLPKHAYTWGSGSSMQPETRYAKSGDLRIAY
jgi:hypothetical protein